jgi:hypothetical protein
MIERLLLFGATDDLVGRHWLASKGYLATSTPTILPTFYLQVDKKEPTSGLENRLPLLQLRVIIQVLQRFARACKCPISKLVSLLRFALCCTVLRSRWCQSGVNITSASAFHSRPPLGLVNPQRESFASCD